ncbi:alpha/beta fold hydrolase [Mariprofundus ferrooxydans]|uniref:alpha/beta fold hydrolase n=1 Tax=Mariprofundus ferrooxydans TaxID=314344 RepID=UPI00142FE4DF|nr:alpha/beta fold hydrolase [Mariprofundus ferrooxydans]
MTPPLVFLHGWAQSRQIWYQQQRAFPQAHFLNLPGHGGAMDAPADAWLDLLVAQLPDEPCALIGWSLGGMLALEIAHRFPDRIAALALIATTPRFRTDDAWSCGCDEATFAAFHEAVASASPRALNRFFALMLHGDDLPRSRYNELARHAVDRQCPATSSALSAGLALLASLDLRQSLALADLPVLLMHGEQDAIVPVAAGRWLAEQLPGAQAHYADACGHAPFLSQPERFNTILKEWWQQ